MATQVIQEHVGGSSGGVDTLIATYYVYDDGTPPAAVSRSTAITAATNQFATDMGFAGTDSADNQVSNHSWRVDVSWSPAELDRATPPITGSAQYFFDYRAKDEKVDVGLVIERLGPNQNADETFDPGNTSFVSPPSLITGRGLFEPLAYEADNITVPGGPITDRIVHQFSPPIIPASYKSVVQALMGKVNASSFLGWPAECLRLVLVTSSVRTDSDQTVTFGFAGREQRNRTLGNQTFSNVPGWHHTWMDTVSVFDPNNPFDMQKEVDQAIRQRVVETGNFALLQLPAV